MQTRAGGWPPTRLAPDRTHLALLTSCHRATFHRVILRPLRPKDPADGGSTPPSRRHFKHGPSPKSAPAVHVARNGGGILRPKRPQDDSLEGMSTRASPSHKPPL